MKTPVQNLTVWIVSVLLSVSVFSCSKPTPPSLTTTAVSSITYTTATTGGTVTGDGGAEVTSRGVCWNTSANPTISNSKTSDGKGTGPFTSNLSQLTPGTPYYVRAYATNEAGTGYGNEVMFNTTAISLATVTTTVISATGTTAIVDGNVTADGGSPVTVRGICWVTNTNPTVNDNKTTEGAGTGTFRSTLTALNTGVNYHVRAYATNSAGVAYGNDETFILTGNKPSAAALEPTIQSGSSVILYGTVNPNWAETTVTFEYGLTTSYGTSVPNYEGVLGTGLYDYSVSANIDGLEPGKTYHFRIRAENSLGVTYSTDRTFTTWGDKPTAVTAVPTIQSGSSVILFGTVNPNWAETTVTFEYGLTTSYGTSVPNYEGVLGAGLYDYSVSANIDGLEPGKTYHFRIRAENSLGVTFSADRSFVMPSGK